MSNNKNKLRSELTNLYGGTNKFLTNAEITTIVNRSTGSNHLNLKNRLTNRLTQSTIIMCLGMFLIKW